MGNSRKTVGQIRTKWKSSARLRLRLCLECHNPFPSAGAESRFCPRCLRRIDDARARMAMDSPTQKILTEIEEWFDGESVDRNRRQYLLDVIARRKRQRHLGC